ncbi:hypothetical protein EDB83DRAFT_2316047 [Lactarius deliciosus]|nr:hypothetical protein EDB83DRAFT_2316047 [Lactarius deliciosus]
MSIPHFTESTPFLARTRSNDPSNFLLPPSHSSSARKCPTAKYLRHLWDQPHQAFGVPRHAITAFLVEALAFQVELEAENMIGETVVLCRELLTLGISDVNTTRSTLSLSEQFCPRFIRRPQINHWIKSSSASGEKAFGNDDYEEAFSSGDSQGEFVTKAQWFVATLAMIRSFAHKTRQYITLIPLYCETMHRFHYFGPIEGPEARSNYSCLKLSQSAVAFYDNLNGGDKADFGRIHKQIGILGGLLDLSPINEAVKIGRTIQYLLHLLQSIRLASVPGLFDSFRHMLFEVFKRTKKIEHLD